MYEEISITVVVRACLKFNVAVIQQVLVQYMVSKYIVGTPYLLKCEANYINNDSLIVFVWMS